MENKGIIRDKMHHFDEEYEDVGHGAMEPWRATQDTLYMKTKYIIAMKNKCQIT